jgi:hypothetical protein
MSLALQKGLRTYPSGFIPDKQAVFLNSKSYRNRGDGLFFHNSRNLAVVGGIFADNREQLDFDRAEEIEFRDATVIGVSDEYRSLLQSQAVSSICASYDSVVGIQLHTFSRSTKDNGATIENITLSGFVNTGCSQAVAVDFDDEVSFTKASLCKHHVLLMKCCSCIPFFRFNVEASITSLRYQRSRSRTLKPSCLMLATQKMLAFQIFSLLTSTAVSDRRRAQSLAHQRLSATTAR